MKDNKYRTLFKALNRIKEENPDIKLIKVYYIDEDNFTIKGIDESGDKCFTKRIAKDRKLKAFDNDYREKVGKYGKRTSFQKLWKPNRYNTTI